VRVKVVRAGPGVGWVTDALTDLHKRLRPGVVLAAGTGPVVELHEPIRRAGVPLRVLTEREYATATGRFLSMLDAGTLDHDGTQLLHDGVVGLVTRAALSGDGVAFARRASVGDTSPGVAAAIVADSVHRNGGVAAPLQVFGPAA
jgi:hypothetical protein